MVEERTPAENSDNDEAGISFGIPSSSVNLSEERSSIKYHRLSNHYAHVTQETICYAFLMVRLLMLLRSPINTEKVRPVSVKFCRRVLVRVGSSTCGEQGQQVANTIPEVF